MERHAVIVAGFGFSTRASVESLLSAYLGAGGRADALATLSDKVAALEPLARRLDLPVISVTDPSPLTETRSPRSLGARGVGSVAEACALDAAGAGAYLLSRRVVSDDRLATCAIAQGGNE